MAARKVAATIGYINPRCRSFDLPRYRGREYPADVPDTFDLAEMARLAVNGLTGPTDPDADGELYWWVRMNQRPIAMRHDFNDQVQAKFLEALPLMRLISGSEDALDVEREWFQALLRMQGPDGLIYFPAAGRPWYRDGLFEDFADAPDADQWASACMCGRYLGALTLYALLTGDDLWRAAAAELACGLRALALDRDDYSFFEAAVYGPDYRPNGDAPVPAMPRVRNQSAWAGLGLVQYARAFGDEQSLDLALRLARYNVRDREFWGDDCSFGGDGHFHAHTYAALFALEAGLVAGEPDLLEFADAAYLAGRALGQPLTGFFPESYPGNQRTTETCAVADMVALALKLSAAGIGDYWDDADRYLRNQFAENQLRQAEEAEEAVADLPLSEVDPVCETADRVAERNVGAFAGWPSPNQFYLRPSGGPGALPAGMMHCCTGNAARAMYYAWEHSVTRELSGVRINLLANHCSPWADVKSHMPYDGRVQVRMKTPGDLVVRVPEWCAPHHVSIIVENVTRPPISHSRFVHVGHVHRGQTATLTFPLPERREAITVAGETYRLDLKGNDVISVDPAGEVLPLYRRERYRSWETRYRPVLRFVADDRPEW